MNRIMLDLETLATSNDSAVAAIGAVLFDENVLLGEFEAYLFLPLVPGHRDRKTLEWWNEQDPEVHEKVFGGRENIYKALERLSLFWKKYKVSEVWANAPTFDCIILRTQFELAGFVTPWHFREERCFRTLVSLARQKKINYSEAYQDIIKHDPLSDAKAQARATQIILRSL